MTNKERITEILKAYTKKNNIPASSIILKEYAEELVKQGVVMPIRCEDCKHLTIHTFPTLYEYCEKTHYRFKPFKTDTRTHFCGFGESKEREG